MSQTVSSRYLLRYPNTLRWKKLFVRVAGRMDSCVVERLSGGIAILKTRIGKSIRLSVDELINETDFIAYKEDGRDHCMSSSGIGWSTYRCDPYLVRVIR